MKGLSQTDILTRIRQAYRGEGYTVEIQTRLDDGAGTVLQPDLLAQKGSETVLVGIKTIGSGPEEATRLARLAQAAQEREGWTFRMILAEDREAAPVQRPSYEEIRERIADARRLWRKGDHAAAYLYAWSLMAAGAGRGLEAFGAAPMLGEPVQSLVKTMVAHGLAEQDDLAWLEPAADLFERLSGGYATLPVDQMLFDRLCVLVGGLAQARPTASYGPSANPAPRLR